MKPSSVAYNFINDNIDLLNESIREFLRKAYVQKLANRYIQEIVAMLNDVGIETADDQWALFDEVFQVFNDLTKTNVTQLDVFLTMFSNWFGLSYSDIKFWLLDHDIYSHQWYENNQGEIIRR